MSETVLDEVSADEFTSNTLLSIFRVVDFCKIIGSLINVENTSLISHEILLDICVERQKKHFAASLPFVPHPKLRPKTSVLK